MAYGVTLEIERKIDRRGWEEKRGSEMRGGVGALMRCVHAGFGVSVVDLKGQGNRQ
ncbi:hypothetical protein WUBG_01486 [Wuchereria bancrofti]|uniref:Uncharacterized protein n=1 Tax=Wuchereria bancrofti TaxID=6293 RepID=J9EYD1_WUCBA|nr:hypothetical protein WUBG_01486 [Wuchereria bancrofti]